MFTLLESIADPGLVSCVPERGSQPLVAPARGYLAD
jgi:hypothetical protein